MFICDKCCKSYPGLYTIVPWTCDAPPILKLCKDCLHSAYHCYAGDKICHRCEDILDEDDDCFCIEGFITCERCLIYS